MDRVKQYRRRAEECLELAAGAPIKLKHHYYELASMWDRMADERLAFFVPGSEDSPQDEKHRMSNAYCDRR
jgi:hypothetical protein